MTSTTKSGRKAKTPVGDRPPGETAQEALARRAHEERVAESGQLREIREQFVILLEAFAEALTRNNHTLKRALTDPRLFSGIGNAYSDEILHAAHLSPLKQTRSLSEEETTRLFDATRATLHLWLDRLREATAGGFPEIQGSRLTRWLGIASPILLPLVFLIAWLTVWSQAHA